MAGIITYIAPVDYGQGKIFGKKNKWTAVKRSFGNKQKGCAYGGDRNMVNHPITEGEKAKRAMSAAVFKAVAARRNPLSTTYTQDLLTFNAQKNQPNGYQTFRQWLYWQERQKYETTH